MKINREAIAGKNGGVLLSEIFGVSEEEALRALNAVKDTSTDQSLHNLADILESEVSEGAKLIAVYGAGMIQGQLNVYDKFGLLD